MGDRPLVQRLYDAAGVAPLLVGAGLFLAELVLCSAVAGFDPIAGGAAPGGLGGALGGLTATNVLFALLIGYAPTATAYSRLAARRSLDELRPALECSDGDFERLAEETLRFDMWIMRRAGLCFAVASVVVVYLGTAGPQLAPSARFLALWENGLASWLGARAIANEIQVARGFSRLGSEHIGANLLNVRQLEPFGHRGVQGALVAIIEITLLALLQAEVGGAAWNPILQVAILTLALLLLWLPVRGARSRIAEEKRRKLEQLAREVEIAEQRMMSPGADDVTAESVRLTALVTLEQRLGATREWPLDRASLTRFALYLAIGLALAAVPVGRAVEFVLRSVS